MSAPTSLMACNGTNGPAGGQQVASKEQQQQLIDNLYATTFNADSIEITGLEQQLKKSSSNKQISRQLHPISKSPSSHHFHRLDQIDSKFNALAKKIFDELHHVQSSREFFKAIDEILGEQPAKTYAQQRASLGSRRRLRPPATSRNVELVKPTTLKTLVEPTDDQQLRSLPFEPAHQPMQRQPRFNPIVRSHTISGNGHRVKPANPTGQPTTAARLAANYRGSVLRNINNNSNNNNNNYHHIDGHSARGSGGLVSGINLSNSKEAAASLSLYKPHMNYSTSVLGNHRLSDDDEIIIIPTSQSPSSLISSTSSDNSYSNYHQIHQPQQHQQQQQQHQQQQQQHLQQQLVSVAGNRNGAGAGNNLAGDLSDDDPTAEEITERFSISRTKSFWEKLAKGGGGKGANGGNILIDMAELIPNAPLDAPKDELM